MAMQISINSVPKYIVMEDLGGSLSSPNPITEPQGIMLKILDSSGNLTADVTTGITDFLNNVVMGNMEAFLKPIANALWEMVKTTFSYLNNFSPEIITLCILACAMTMMVSSFWGQNAGTWVGRGVLVALIGTIWRIVI